MMRLKGFIKRARTIEGLAKKLKLPAEELRATAEHYNQLEPQIVLGMIAMNYGLDCGATGGFFSLSVR